MAVLQGVITHTGNLCLVALLIGLFVRERHTHCLTFTLYIVAVVLAQLLVLLFPGRFYNWDFWVFKEVVHNLLKFAIAVELAVRTFRVFPGAGATAKWVMLFVLVGTAIAVFAVPSGDLDYLVLAGQVHGRILNGTMWLFTGVAAVILWYRLPVTSLHKAILLGFVPYLLIFTLAMQLLRHFGWEAKELLHYPPPIAYVCLLLYWNRVVWRQETTVSPENQRGGD